MWSKNKVKIIVEEYAFLSGIAKFFFLDVGNTPAARCRVVKFLVAMIPRSSVFSEIVKLSCVNKVFHF